MKTLRTAFALATLLICSSAWAGKCTVTEFVSLPTDGRGNLLYIPEIGPNTPTQSVTYTSSTQAATAFQSSTQYVRVFCDAEAHIAIGPDMTTATAADPGLPAGGWEYIKVPRHSVDYYIAIYDGTS